MTDVCEAGFGLLKLGVSFFPMYGGTMLDTFFFRTAVKEPDAPALQVDGETVSYRNPAIRARAVSHTLHETVRTGTRPG